MPSRVLTVMFTDIKGFTERTSHSSRKELDHILKEHEDLLMPLIPEFGGRLIKTVGDALMIVFDSPTNAVLCGIMMQERLHERNQDLSEADRLEVRVAINSGEMLEREGDVFGDAVNIAARIEGITEASEIYFTESVYLAMNKAEVPSSELGMRRLKGIPEPIKIYRVIQDRHSDEYQNLLERLRSGTFEDVPVPTAGTPPSGARKAPAESGRPILLGAAVLGAAAVVVLALYLGGVFTPAADQGSEGPPSPSSTPTPSPAPPAPVDPVPEAVKKVDEAISKKGFGLALARAEALLKDHPDREEAHAALQAVVEAEARDLVAKKLFPDAIQLIEERRKTQNYVTFRKVEREVLLAYAADSVQNGRRGQAENIYGLLYRTRPEDLEVHRIIVRNLGGRANSLAVAAALRVAAMTEGPLDEPTAQALIGGFGRHQPTHDRPVAIRKLLAERFPAATEMVRKTLHSDKRYVRMNAYLFLKELGKITPEEELAVHVKNL
ncbi:MAG: adenylate/guanylate cyclase domain-containing protein, partial [Planctomycetota bacterium]